MMIGMIAIATASRDPVAPQGRPGPFRIRIGVPHGQALGFLTFVAPATFMMSFIEGTLLSVVPIFVVETLGVDNLAVVGADRLPDAGARRRRPLRRRATSTRAGR